MIPFYSGKHLQKYKKKQYTRTPLPATIYRQKRKALHAVYKTDRRKKKKCLSQCLLSTKKKESTEMLSFGGANWS